MLRIVQVIAGMNPAGGGPSVVAGRLAAALARTGQHVTMACWLDPSARQHIERDLSTVAGTQLLQWFDLPDPRAKIERFFAPGSRRRLDELIPQADFVHLHGVWESTLRVAADISRRHNVPYAVTPHGMFDPWAMGQKTLKKQIALSLGIRRMIDRAAFIHCLNDAERSCVELMKFKCPLEIIANGIGVEEMNELPARGEFYRAKPELQGDPYLLFLGRLHRGKGLDYVADAFGKLSPKYPRLRLVIAGPDAGARDDFQKQIQRMNLQDRVHVVGPIYGPGKFAALIDAFCFVLPSEHECFSMAVLESLACGVPVVISEESNFPEVQQAGVGFVRPRSADAFAEAIERLLKDEPLRQSMGRNGRQLVEQKYTWDRVAQTTLKAYQRARSAVAEHPVAR